MRPRRSIAVRRRRAGGFHSAQPAATPAAEQWWQSDGSRRRRRHGGVGRGWAWRSGWRVSGQQCRRCRACHRASRRRLQAATETAARLVAQQVDRWCRPAPGPVPAFLSASPVPKRAPAAESGNTKPAEGQRPAYKSSSHPSNGAGSPADSIASPAGDPFELCVGLGSKRRSKSKSSSSNPLMICCGSRIKCSSTMMPSVTLPL